MIEYQRRPWGDDWLQTGTIASAASAGAVKKVVPPEKFIPRVKKRTSEPMSADAIQKHLVGTLLAVKMGGV